VAVLFGRSYRVVVGAAIGALRAGLRVDSHRCAFVVEKTLKPEPNTCSLQIWNLSRTQRDQIAELEPKDGSTRGIPVLIEAGYTSTGTAQIWLGDLRTARTERDGADWVTTIESGDGEQAIKNARIATSLGPLTRPDVALRAIVQALGVDQGNLPAALAQLASAGMVSLAPKRLVLSGSAADHLTNFCKSADLEWSIQDGAVQILKRGSALPFATRLASDRASGGTGLVESPSVDPKGVLSCKTLIQTQIRVGGLVTVEAQTVRGTYKIDRARWSGDTHGTAWYVDLEAKRY
jgi:hypothetical protein